MTLTDNEIERYSRQIIVAGGVAQERLRAARIVVVGTIPAVEPALRYLVGAGIGHIGLYLGDADNNARRNLVGRLHGLDSSVTIEGEESPKQSPDLCLMIISGPEVLAKARAIRAMYPGAALIAVWLALPVAIAISPARERPKASAGGELSRAWPESALGAESAVNPGFVTMVAVTEALKLLMEPAATVEPKVIEFEGYQTRVHPLIDAVWG